MQRTVDHGRVNRAAHRLLIGRLHGRDHEYPARFGPCQKGSKQLLLLRRSRILVTATAFRLAEENRFPLPSVIGVPLPHRRRLPA